MLSVYPALFYKEKDGQYTVIFPDLGGLATCGHDLKEAVTMAVDCLASHLYGEKKDGHPWPEASSIETIDAKAIADAFQYTEYESVFVNMVSVDVAAYARSHFEKAVKKTLTIPAWLNALAVEQHLNFSKILKQALMKELGLSDPAPHKKQPA